MKKYVVVIEGTETDHEAVAYLLDEALEGETTVTVSDFAEPVVENFGSQLLSVELDDETLNSLMAYICNQLGVRPQKMSIRIDRVKEKIKEMFTQSDVVEEETDEEE